jgi:hypothetical protein
VERALDVHREDGFAPLVSRVDDRRERGDGGVVDEDVDCVERLLSLIEERRELLAAADVGGAAVAVTPTLLADAGDDRLRLRYLGLQVIDDHRRAATGQTSGDPFADPGRCAGDDLACERLRARVCGPVTQTSSPD